MTAMIMIHWNRKKVEFKIGGRYPTQFFCMVQLLFFFAHAHVSKLLKQQHGCIYGKTALPDIAQ